MQHATWLQHFKTDDTVNLVDPSRVCVWPRPPTRQRPSPLFLHLSLPLPLCLILLTDTLQYRFHALSASGLAQIDVFELVLSQSLSLRHSLLFSSSPSIVEMQSIPLTNFAFITLVRFVYATFAACASSTPASRHLAKSIKDRIGKLRSCSTSRCPVECIC